MTNAEATKYALNEPLHCIKPECSGHVTQMGCGPGYKECCTCDRKWDFVNKRGQSVTPKEFSALMEARTRKSLESRKLESMDEGTSVMAAKKVKKMSVKKTSAKPKKTSAKPKKTSAKLKNVKSEDKPKRITFGGFATDMFVKNPSIDPQKVADALNKTFPDHPRWEKNDAAWYRSKARAAGLVPIVDVEVAPVKKTTKKTKKSKKV